MASILVVDDSHSIREYVGGLLRRDGHAVTDAADGRAALRHLRQRTFDVMVTDLYMPEVDGLELILRSRASGIMPPLIAMSSVEMAIDLLAAARLMGAECTLRKPFTADQLRQAVQSVVSAMPAPGSAMTARPHGTIAKPKAPRSAASPTYVR